MKRTLLIVICAMVSLCAANMAHAQETWDGVIGTGFYGGTGTQSDPYTIRTPHQLAYFIRQMSDGNSFSGKYIRLDRDVDMAGTAINAVNGSCFYGDFNGNGNIIYNWNPMGKFVHKLGGSNLEPSLKGVIRNTVFSDKHSTVFGQSNGGIVYSIGQYGLIFNCKREVDVYLSVFESHTYYTDHSGWTCYINGDLVYCQTTGSVYADYRHESGYYGGTWTAHYYGYAQQCNSPFRIINCSNSIVKSGLGDAYYISTTPSTEGWADFQSSHTSYNYTRPGVHSGTVQVTISDPDGLYNSTVNLSTPATYANIPTPTGLDLTLSGWKRLGVTNSQSSTTSINRPYVTVQPVWSRVIKQQPTSGAPTVVVDDKAHATYQWYGYSGSGSYTAVSGQTSSTLTSYQEGYSYYCRVSYTNCSTTLTTNKISFTATPITDGSSYYRSTAGYEYKLEYKRTFTSDNFEPLFVPFASNRSDWPSDVTIYELYNMHQYDLDNDGTKESTVMEIVKLNNDATVEANTPYIIQADGASSIDFILNNPYMEASTGMTPVWCASTTCKYTFTGNYSSKSISASSEYVMKDNKMTQLSASETLSPMRWYLTVEGRNGNSVSNARAMNIQVLGDETTDIRSSLFQSHEVKEVYNINGVKTNTMHKGLNIIRMSDGTVRKVIMK